MKYKGIFWDIDNTLYDSSAPWEVSREIEEDLLIGRKSLDYLSKEQLSCFVPYEGLPELMNDLPKETQGIISNGGNPLQIDKLKLLGLYDFVNPALVFTSYGEIEKILENKCHPLHYKSKDKNIKDAFLELRKYTGKPSSYMFEKALKKSRLNAKNCMMIGDDWKDIEGAQKVGMDNVLVSSNDEPLYNPWNNKIITPNHKLVKGDIRGLRKLLGE